jgi:hypothetical protein
LGHGQWQSGVFVKRFTVPGRSHKVTVTGLEAIPWARGDQARLALAGRVDRTGGLVVEGGLTWGSRPPVCHHRRRGTVS